MLSVDFFDCSTPKLAQKLLGCILIHQTKEGTTSGRIVETEAYLIGDPASHSYKGERSRNKAMFGPAGTAYIYLIYGLHYCLNVVSGQTGVGEAVLIRALEPVEGIPLMQKRRGTTTLQNLCRGPARLVQALGVSIQQNEGSLLNPPLYIEEGALQFTETISASPRIGISVATEEPLRFYLYPNSFVSGPKNNFVNNPQSLRSS